MTLVIVDGMAAVSVTFPVPVPEPVIVPVGPDMAPVTVIPPVLVVLKTRFVPDDGPAVSVKRPVPVFENRFPTAVPETAFVIVNGETPACVMELTLVPSVVIVVVPEPDPAFTTAPVLFTFVKVSPPLLVFPM
jgi:hypothetical protein